MLVMPKPKAKSSAKPALVGVHVRLPTALYRQVLAQRDSMRKQNPMRNLSDAVRALLEVGIEHS
jgi:hypothetical protein